uniref:Tenascin-X n=1 Tax=Anas platyrhynchos TaxID=8839 RepID=A0A8B9SV33_ANAPL
MFVWLLNRWIVVRRDVYALHCALHIAAPPPAEEEPPSQPHLGELTASHVTPDSVQLEWSVPEGTFDSFTVQYKDAQGQPQVLPVDGDSRTVTVPGLSPSRRYKFNLYGMWGRKRVGPVSTDLTVSHITPSSVQLEWSVPEGTFDSFTLQYRDVQGQPHALRVDGDSRTVTVPGLLPSHRYKFNLYGMWGRKRLGPISTDAEPPSQPYLGELTASHVTRDSVQLEWSVPEGKFDSFKVQYKDEQDQLQVLPVDGDSRTVTVPGLSPSHHYKFNLYGMWGQKRLGPISTDTVTGETPLLHPYPRDCVEEQLNGPRPSHEALIFLGGDRQRPLRVFCDMETDGGGWLVFQRRMNGATDFWRGWEEYAHGFGNVSQEFWLGNEALHALTAAGPTELRVDLRTPLDAAFAHYRDFAVAGPEEHYRLHLGAYSGTAGDAMSYHAGSPFSTMPTSPDKALSRSPQGINWFPWKGFEFSIPFTEMKLRPHLGRAPGTGGSRRK